MSIPIQNLSSSPAYREEAILGSVPHADQATLGYVTIKPPLSSTFPVCPQTYRCGLNKNGKIIGRNVSVPYPGELPKYHDVPCLRCVDWAGCVETGTLRRDEVKQQQQHPCTITKQEAKTETLDEYFTAENDEGYHKWAEKMKCAEQKKKENTEKVKESGEEENEYTCRVNELRKTPITSSENIIPVRMPTTNQTYGGYFQLQHKNTTPTFPGHVKPIALPSIPRQHPNCLNLSQPAEHFGSNLKPHTPVSAKTTYFVAYVPHPTHQPQTPPIPQTLVQGGITPAGTAAVAAAAGRVDKCYTFPLHNPTGLEMNRQPYTNLSLFSTMGKQRIKPSGIVPRVSTTHINSRPLRVCVPYSLPPPRDSRSKPEISDGHLCVQTPKLLC